MSRLRAATAPGAALPLGVLYLALAALHVWQASRHATPTLFSDEIEFTQVSRSIAASGSAELRGGTDAGFPGLYAYVAAPAWWLDDTGDAYEAIKTLGALLMTAVLFPAYGLARLVASRPAAVLAAAAAAAAPALAYAPFLVEEPLAYPAATLALLLVARWVAEPTRGRLAAAAAGCALATLTRTQLSILFAVLGLAALTVVWRHERLRAWRRGWTRSDWTGAAVLTLGAALALFAFVSHRSYSWYVATTFFKGRMLDFGLWAFGALAIGLGILPFVAGLAGLLPRRGRFAAGQRALATVTVSAVVGFGLYTAVKGAYLSTTFADLTLERNVIYVAPLLLAGAAALLERGGGRVWAVVAAAAAAVVLVFETPYSLANYPNYEAHGLAILALANREFPWTEERIEDALLVIVVATTAALVLLPALRLRTLRLGVAGVLAAGALGWMLTAEIYAVRGENGFAARFHESLPQPPDWLDRMTNGARAVFLGQGIRDHNPIYSLEFWNRSLKGVWSLDATAPGPGAVVTADLARPDGTLHPPPDADWVVAADGVRLEAGDDAERVGVYTVKRLNGPIRLSSAVSGVSPDGWMGSQSSYDRYDATRGLAKIVVSRTGWGGRDKPGRVTITLGTLGVTRDRRPVIARVTQVVRDEINSGEELPFILRAPPGPWRAEVTVEPTFSPHELDPSISDTRQLGAQMSFDYLPLTAS